MPQVYVYTNKFPRDTIFVVVIVIVFFHLIVLLFSLFLYLYHYLVMCYCFCAVVIGDAVIGHVYTTFIAFPQFEWYEIILLMQSVLLICFRYSGSGVLFKADALFLTSFNVANRNCLFLLLFGFFVLLLFFPFISVFVYTYIECA